MSKNIKLEDLEVEICSNGNGRYFLEFVDRNGDCVSLGFTFWDLLEIHKLLGEYINDVSGGIIDDSADPLEPNTGWPNNSSSRER